MRRGGWLAVAASVIWLDLVLIQPNHPAALGWRALLLIPLELPVIVLALLALGDGRAGRAFRVVLVALLTLIAVLKTADFTLFTALGRGFNPVADWPLVDAGLRLLSGTLGPVAAVAAALGVVLLVGLIAGLLWLATGALARRAPQRPLWRWTAGGAAALAAVLAVAEIGQAMGRWRLPVAPPGAAFTARVGVERLQLTRRTLADLREFRLAAATDPFAGQAGLLDAIDRDVLVIFVESYGRTSLDTPLYVATHRPTLERAEAALAEAGLAMRSGFLTSPTSGGQSWLAHETLAYGLWLDNQVRYQAALASGRQSLFTLARAAGFRTAAVVPAITMDWPEAAVLGFDRVLAAGDLGYRGQPFNWVTMPDQFTLAALDRLLRGPGRAEPLFAHVSLISSHAPWVPVPAMVPWEDLGDGRIFDAMATSGDAPDVVWRDRDRVRDQYRQAIDYALTAVFDYARRQAGDTPLMVILGDHQAAGFVALDDRREVPVHILGPAALVDRVQGWGWTAGLIPDPALPPVPMQDFRALFLRAFTTAPVAAEDHS